MPHGLAKDAKGCILDSDRDKAIFGERLSDIPLSFEPLTRKRIPQEVCPILKNRLDFLSSFNPFSLNFLRCRNIVNYLD